MVALGSFTTQGSIVLAKRILLLRDDDFFFYLHQLAVLLKSAGYDVHVVFTSTKEIEPLYQDLRDDVESRGIICDCIIDRSTRVTRTCRKILFKLGLVRTRALTRRKICNVGAVTKDHDYDSIIALGPAALFLAWKAFPAQRNRIIEYSLEVVEESHPAFHNDRELRFLVEHERKVLPHLRALMIQDRFREALLLKQINSYDRRRTVYFPVTVSGPRVVPHREGSPKIVLFYGGLWSNDLRKQLRKAAKQLSSEYLVMIRGGRGADQVESCTDKNYILDKTPIPFSELDGLIATAHIGIALYPNEDLNSRTTAFSSEKIARYCKFGIPFIAFDNPDYRYLKTVHDCCMLIQTYDELPEAIKNISERYEYYQENSWRAFDQFYCLENNCSDLLDLLSESRSA